ncbi:MAG TPA: HNH endonuclease [Candidatus Thiothrix moscowensis]|mgnify:CR=1 FL=1|uniref:HNH endonuclease n=1 Tax=unclassified Thiothrix TaxID=2636184 RepID=UPI0025DCE672|nr:MULTISPECIES: HNH endonuclease [unclassified Thiothrix]HRJ52683.1 HNH endonuclease [Candidatus Thiothrix moscowensis]HRJ92833.1 HNH endonuclease [Candidatus Thiothrix moscowensis]
MYDTEKNDGLVLWNNVQKNLNEDDVFKNYAYKPDNSRIEESNVLKYGNPYLTKPRIGQGSFRLLVTDAYKRRCAITGESTLPVLEAAHIVPYSQSGTHDISNGLLLRADFHKLFDSGLVTVKPDLTIKISSRIKESYFNGKAYYRLQGCKLASIPEAPNLRPNPDFLDWHNRNRFIQ